MKTNRFSFQNNFWENRTARKEFSNSKYFLCKFFLFSTCIVWIFWLGSDLMLSSLVIYCFFIFLVYFSFLWFFYPLFQLLPRFWLLTMSDIYEILKDGIYRLINVISYDRGDGCIMISRGSLPTATPDPGGPQSYLLCLIQHSSAFNISNAIQNAWMFS